MNHVLSYSIKRTNFIASILITSIILYFLIHVFVHLHVPFTILLFLLFLFFPDLGGGHLSVKIDWYNIIAKKSVQKGSGGIQGIHNSNSAHWLSG